MTFHHRLRVRFHECDPQGIVFNAHYLAYADIAVTELYREAFGSWDAPMAEHGVDMVVAEANARFLAPLRFDEEVDLVVTLPRIGETSTTTRVEVVRDAEPTAVVELRHVFVDAGSRSKTPIPAAVRAALDPYCEIDRDRR
jgi:acyl-CoA thioester hydrolase